MQSYNRPKGFGEILDETFKLCKNNFSKFFLILLIIMGPIYLLEAIILLSNGTSFFRELGAGESLVDQIVAEIDAEATASISWSREFGNIFIGLALLVAGPIAQASILIGVMKQKNNEGFTAGMVIKNAFSKFWPILGSSLIFGAILFGLVLISFIIILIVGAVSGIAIPFVGIVLTIPLFLGVAAGVIFLLTRWSLYLCAVVFEEDFPGLSRSWHLTSNNSWRLIGLYVVLFLITFALSLAIEGLFTIFLGYSVLHTIIVNLISFITSMIFAVCYAVIYFDLRVRKEADDLNEMIDDYKTEQL
ncbi:hypothetical protein [Ornithinibacillus halophilus]|uniref:Membrane domain of glycerophosphoryl diester phosphodiesterase n=1 Tax=Ornithinibacillus halophilus TaxID=930117 RepID=A0A1M5G9P6_9BACI|nr:hypothetical protein [Ornithinibacillus halophilus]SHG00181.1 hypothetical protein SAMN05216225_10127 [Ornithinibacillus halophilus]